MLEPDDEEVKDYEGYSWIDDPLGGWSLKNHNQPCYLNLPWPKVESEYGPMHKIGE